MSFSRFLAAAVLLGFIAPGQAGAEIGSVAAVNRDMDGTPPAATRRTLTLGNRIVQNERIETSTAGSGQLMFLDQTTLTVAPASDIVLDEYIYNPETTSGTMTLRMGRGMLRLVGGRITKKSEAIIRTPTATVGIRGGMVLIEVLADGTTRAVLLAGEFAWIEDEEQRRIYLSRPNSEAEVSNGRPVFRGLLGPTELARYYDLLEGTSNGGSDLGGRATDEVEAPTVTIAAVNSGAEGGERRQPVSTSGEQPVDNESTNREDVRDEDGFQAAGGGPPPVDPTDPTDPTGGGGGPVVVPPILPATGGVFFSGQAPTPFNSIAQGSLIGTDVLGNTLRIPVAETNADFENLSSIPGISGFTLGQNRENAGVVVFGVDDGATSSQFGNLEGFGYSDLDEDFHFYQFEAIPADPTGTFEPVPGFVVFGNPSPNQLNTFSLDDGTLDGGVQNVVEAFDVNNFFDFTGPLDNPPALFVKNADQSRELVSESAARLIFADETLEDAGGNLQISRFGVYIHKGRANNSGRLVEGVFRGTENDAGTLTVEERPFSPVQTEPGPAIGPIVFGSNEDYIVLGPVSGLPADLRFEPGEVRALGQIAETAPFGGVLLERDPSAAELINDPIPLAGENLIRGGNGLFDTGAVSGFAVCSGGNCGLTDVTGAREGFYALRGGYGPSVRMEFNSTGLDSNAFRLARLQMSDASVSNIQGANDFFEFRATLPGDSAYVDDRRFVVNQGDGPATLAGVLSTSNSADFILASSELFEFELTGDGGVKDVDVSPDFVRWGRWSASLDITDAETGAPRHDVVHMGSWIAGIAPDNTLLPTDGIAFYEGIATGTEFDFNSNQFRQVNGTFNMDYDFGRASGSIELDLDTGVFTGLPLAGDISNPAAYGTNIDSPDFKVQITGGFFAGGGDQVAATGGEFTIEDNFGVNHTRTIGVFAGDKLPGS